MPCLKPGGEGQWEKLCGSRWTGGCCKLVPSHVMLSLSEVTREVALLLLPYGHRIRWMRTHSCKHIRLR